MTVTPPASHSHVSGPAPVCLHRPLPKRKLIPSAALRRCTTAIHGHRRLSSAAMALANAVPGFLKLPLELMHEIVADVDAHADLMAIALTCRSFSHLIIPGHLEYRIIRVRHPLSSMWHHLAKRRDLARNIREVHFCDRNDYSDSDRWPKRLVEGTPTTDEVTRIKNICTALHHMEKLVVFTWTSMERLAGPTQCPLHEDAILQALCGKPSLQRLAVIGNLGTHAVGTNLDPKSVVYPVCG